MKDFPKMKQVTSDNWEVILDGSHGGAYCSKDGKTILTSTWNSKISGFVWRVFYANQEIAPLNTADHLMDDPDKLVPGLTEEPKKKYWWS